MSNHFHSFSRNPRLQDRCYCTDCRFSIPSTLLRAALNGGATADTEALATAKLPRPMFAVVLDLGTKTFAFHITCDRADAERLVREYAERRRTATIQDLGTEADLAKAEREVERVDDWNSDGCYSY